MHNQSGHSRPSQVTWFAAYGDVLLMAELPRRFVSAYEGEVRMLFDLPKRLQTNKSVLRKSALAERRGVSDSGSNLGVPSI